MFNVLYIFGANLDHFGVICICCAEFSFFSIVGKNISKLTLSVSSWA